MTFVRASRVAIILGALAAGVAIRVWVLSTGLGEIDMDEAVMGLMGRHVLDGEISVFFWGQAYGGSQEAILTGAVFAALGASALTLKLVPLILYGGAAVLIWRVGRRTVGESAATLGALLFWLGPAFFVLRSTRAYGFYGTAVVVSLGTLLLALRLRDRDSAREAAGLGLLLGVGWWATPQIIFVALPALVWLVGRAPRILRRVPLIGITAAVGASPWLMWNLRHDWYSLDTTSYAHLVDNGYVDHLRGFFNPLLPMALGLRVPYTQGWAIDRPIGIVIYLALLTAFGAAVLWAMLRRGHPLELLLVVAAAYPFLYSVSPASFYVFEPRYLFLLAPVIALLLARGVVGNGTPTARWRGPRQVLAGGLLVGVGVLTLDALRDINIPHPVNAPRTMAPLLAALDERRVDRLYTPYVLAHRIVFDSDERILAAPIEHVRYPAQEKIVRASPAPAYLFVRDSLLQTEFEEGLGRLAVTPEKTSVGVFDLYVLPKRVLPTDWRR